MDHDGLVVGVFGMQFDLVLAAHETFDGDVVTEPGHHDLTVLGLADGLHREQVAIQDADVAHGHTAHPQQVVGRALEQTALEVGYLSSSAPDFYRQAIIDLLLQVVEPARHTGAYDFGHTDLARRMRDMVIELRLQQRYWHLPPVEILMLHRKLGGLYLLASQLKARVEVGQLIKPYLIDG